MVSCRVERQVVAQVMIFAEGIEKETTKGRRLVWEIDSITGSPMRLLDSHQIHLEEERSDLIAVRALARLREPTPAGDLAATR